MPEAPKYIQREHHVARCPICKTPRCSLTGMESFDGDGETAAYFCFNFSDGAAGVQAKQLTPGDGCFIPASRSFFMAMSCDNGHRWRCLFEHKAGGVEYSEIYEVAALEAAGLDLLADSEGPDGALPSQGD